MPKPKPRKVGNPNNQSVRGFRGVSTEVLRAKRLNAKAPAGQVDRVVSYDPEAVRAAVEALLCPFCGRGPFKALAVHTVQAHGVDKMQLRDMAGLRLSDSLCAPETRQRFHENGKRSANIYAAVAASKRERKPRQWTEAGKAISEGARKSGVKAWKAACAAENEALAARFAELGSTAEAVSAMSGEMGIDRRSLQNRLRRLGCAVPDTRAAANKARSRITPEHRAEIARLYLGGASQSQVARHFGVGQARISEILRQDGVPARPFSRSPRSTSEEIS